VVVDQVQIHPDLPVEVRVKAPVLNPIPVVVRRILQVRAQIVAVVANTMDAGVLLNVFMENINAILLIGRRVI
jgi:hypothetical protein